MSFEPYDLRAIKAYFDRTSAVTVEAQEIKNRFNSWYNALGWYALSVDVGNTYNEARTLRNAFNLANAVTPEQKAQVREIFKEGLTSEEGQGQSRPIIDPVTGQVKSAHTPMNPYLLGGLVGAGALAVGYGALKIRKKIMPI